MSRAGRVVAALVAVAALGVVTRAVVTAWPAVVHGHRAYAVLLVLTLAVAAVAGAVAVRAEPAARHPAPVDRPRRPSPARWVLRVTTGVAVVLVVGTAAWARPYPAAGPPQVGDDVVVLESATRITLAPTTTPTGTGLVFQPGARVDARAYVGTLEPLARAGHLVVVVKQPLGIGFLATGAFERARGDHPEVQRWAVGGHSLGGTVASLDAAAHAPGRAGDPADPAGLTGTAGTAGTAGPAQDGPAPVVGLLLWASYPASDIGAALDGTVEVLSVWATEDGLATPADIEASCALLPAGARFVAVDGAAHASFGDYGPQPGDGTPTIDGADARAQVAALSAELLDALR